MLQTGHQISEWGIYKSLSEIKIVSRDGRSKQVGHNNIDCQVGCNYNDCHPWNKVVNQCTAWMVVVGGMTTQYPQWVDFENIQCDCNGSLSKCKLVFDGTEQALWHLMIVVVQSNKADVQK